MHRTHFSAKTLLLFALTLTLSGLTLCAENTQPEIQQVAISPAKKALLELVKTPETPDGLIQLPLRVHLITHIELVREETKMGMWLTPADFEKTVLPEINRIWKQANIQWVLEKIVEQPGANLPNREELITYIQNSNRKEEEASRNRVPNILRLSSSSRGHVAVHNLYLFPYIGQTFQGVAARGGNWAVTAAWTDKPFRGKKPPIKFQLVEELPFKIGSIGRTCSHELGHNLGLIHPEKETQTRFHRLMGGKKPGYNLVPEEIKLARKTALKRAQKIRDWATK